MAWFFQHDGKTHGPVSTEEIKSLAEKGLLHRDDPVWAEDADQSRAKPASAMVNFPATMPDWLPDIAALETRPLSVSSAKTEVPDWLEDLRLWIGLELYKPTTEANPITKSAGQNLAKQTLAETGFDPNTGCIVDREKFDQWRNQQAPLTEASRHFLTNESQFEVFRKARTAIERWVDEPVNRLYIVHAGIKEIIKSPGIQAVFRDFAGFGFRQKLEKHLAFLIECRRKHE